MSGDIFENGRVFIFGYGSLMYPDGINGRGMRCIYEYKDIFQAQLNGYERGMYATWGNKLFYGIIEKENVYLNGTVFEVYDLYDLINLNVSENTSPSGINNDSGNYKLIDITDNVTMGEIPFSENFINARCYSYVITNRNLDVEIIGNVGRYEKHVDEGMRWLGKEFVDEFMKTSTNKSNH